jgi:plasmid stabilization system protein ParE
MTLEVIFSSASRADLKKIWQRVSEDRPKTAERIFAKIQRRCSSLGDQPRLGPARPEIDAEARGLIIERWVAL